MSCRQDKTIYVCAPWGGMWVSHEIIDQSTWRRTENICTIFSNRACERVEGRVYPRASTILKKQPGEGMPLLFLCCLCLCDQSSLTPPH